MSSKKRRSGKARGPRQGISGNPQRRAEQIAQQRRLGGVDEADSGPLFLDFTSGHSPLQELARALAGGAEPAPWWGESHERILDAARAATWPARLIDLETQACRIVGDEFYERLNSAAGELDPSQWLRALAEETGATLRADLLVDDGGWQQLWALLRGLALMAPPGDTESDNAGLADELFPDIEDPYETTIAEASLAAKLLADRGLASGIGNPADGWRPAGSAGAPAISSASRGPGPFGPPGLTWRRSTPAPCWRRSWAGVLLRAAMYPRSRPRTRKRFCRSGKRRSSWTSACSTRAHRTGSR